MWYMAQSSSPCVTLGNILLCVKTYIDNVII